MAKKITLSALMICVILTSSYYILVPDKFRIDVENTRTRYRVYLEDKWELSGTEYINLFDGTKKMRAKNRSIEYDIVSGNLYIQRVANYKDNIRVVDSYTFDSSFSDIELVPVEHSTECYNCQGKIMHFEFRDIVYDGITQDVTSPVSLGNNMEIEFQDGYMWAKIYQQKVASDKLIIRYRPNGPYDLYYTRMFDPTPEGAGVLNMTFNNASQRQTGIYNVTFAQDLSFEANNGSVNNATYDNESGWNFNGTLLTGAYKFDKVANDSIDLGVSFVSTDNFTVSGWFNITDNSVSTNTIMHSGGQTRQSFEIRCSTNGLLQNHRWIDGGTDYVYSQTAGFCIDDTWTFFTVVFKDDDTMDIFKDGKFQENQGTTSTGTNAAGNLVIGKRANEGGFTFGGTIDELLIFNTTLTVNQVSALYNSYLRTPLINSSAYINLTLDSKRASIPRVELNTPINITANSTPTNSQVCVDVDHPQYGINYSCEVDALSFLFNVSWFRRTEFNNSNTTNKLKYNVTDTTPNRTIYLNAHQYDEFVNLTINISTFNN